MEMHQVRYFLAVSDVLNFTQAAKSCNVSQPSLTRAIKLLEEELGGPLFHRERANTHLTELGCMVRPHLELVYEKARSAKELAQDFKRLKKTVLKLGIMCTIAPTHLVDLIASVRSRHEDVEVELLDASAEELQERLLSGALEIAIYCMPGEEPDPRLHMMPLFREQMVIVLPPEHPLSKQNAIAAQQLDGEPYLNRVKCEFNEIAGTALTKAGISFNTVYKTERDDWILAMIRSGLGFAFMPQHCVSDADLIARPLVDPEFWRDVNLVTVRGRPHSPAVGALVREAMRVPWRGEPAIAVKHERERARAKESTES